MPGPHGKVDLSGDTFEPPPGLHPDCYLFLGDPEKKTFSEFERFWMPVGFGIGLAIGSLLSNAAARMPLKAAMQRHVMWTLVGGAVGEGGWRFKQKYDAEKDIQYFHYMALHPEDFQPEERRKWAEILQPWLPVR